MGNSTFTQTDATGHAYFANVQFANNEVDIETASEQLFTSLQADAMLRFDYPKFDATTGDFIGYATRELQIISTKRTKKGDRLVTGKRSGEYRSYHFDLMTNVSVAS